MLIAGWTTCNRRAALVTEPSSNRAAKYCIWRISIGLVPELAICIPDRENHSILIDTIALAELRSPSNRRRSVTSAEASAAHAARRDRAGTGAFADLRGWLAHLEATGRLAIAKSGMGLEFEIAGIANRLDGEKASLFPRPGGRDGCVVSGVVSDRGWMAEALGQSEADLLAHFEAAAANPIPWREVQDAPCQQIVNREPDLGRLPIPTHNEHDSGAYITAGLLIARNPKTGRQNAAIHRLQVSGSDRLGALLLPRHTLSFQEMAERDGSDLDVAVAIGAGPSALLASQAIVPLDQDELEIAGALIGRPLDVVKCLNSEIRVPA
ncbi:MAG: UbiD family decarboxylase, partial [Rhizobiaceae bacterium]|nr:UbiD family decarboxylase [Rhizobiaceae bacterium]